MVGFGEVLEPGIPKMLNPTLKIAVQINLCFKY